MQSAIYVLIVPTGFLTKIVQSAILYVLIVPTGFLTKIVQSAVYDLIVPTGFLTKIVQSAVSKGGLLPSAGVAGGSLAVRPWVCGC